MKYLLDTNILLELVKTFPNQSVLTKIELHQHTITTASIFFLVLFWITFISLIKASFSLVFMLFQ